VLHLRAPYVPALVRVGETPTSETNSRKYDFDLHSANASRDGAFKELLLLEKHLSQEQFPECMHKHIGTAIAYCEEAFTLEGGDEIDRRMAIALNAMRGSPDAVEVRAIRKAIARRLGYN